MTRAAFVIPGSIGLPTGGYAYDRRVLGLLSRFGVEAAHIALPGTYPNPSDGDLETTAQLTASTRPGDVLLVDGLAYGAMPTALIERFDRPIVALVHHPLCLEAGITPERAAQLRRLETEALRLARHVVVTSGTTAQTLASEFGVPDARITVAEPGTDPAARAKGSGGEVVRMLAVGSVVPRKAYDVLIEALVPLKVLPWEIDIAGSTELSPDTARHIRDLIERHGFTGRVRLLGAVDEAKLATLYDEADLFVLASHYEGFGMVLTEALARGLPIVCTIGGAAEQTVPDGAGLKVQASSPRALAWTLGRAIEDRKVRQGLSDAAWAAGNQLRRWEDTARTIAAVIQEAGIQEAGR